MQKVRVAVTGAAGQIGYSLLFRIASGEVFGKKCQVELSLIELPQAVRAAEGTAMELHDCGFDTLKSVDIFDTPEKGFEGVNWALLVGSKPRGPGMERNDLIKENGHVFASQGRALSKAAADVRVVVVGNPCNTNCLIAMHHSKDIPAERFSAMTMLDQNRARAQLAWKAGCSVAEVKNVAIWGNHSSTMYPDFTNAIIKNQKATAVISDQNWLRGEFISTVQQRGAAIIEARGKSSAASAASACIDHVQSFMATHREGEFFSAAVASNGEWYGIPSGLVFSFPLRSHGNGKFEVVQGFQLDDFSKQKIKVTTDELLKERDLVKDLLVR